MTPRRVLMAMLAKWFLLGGALAFAVQLVPALL